MKKITKILISLFASTMISLSAFAGELTVTGNAKATYNTVSGNATGDNTIGVSNEISIGATGELENGWTWTYNINLDPADTTDGGGAAINDDSKLVLSTNLGTFAAFGHDGGLNVSGNFSANAYSWPTDTGFAEGKFEPANISDFMNVQYHTPAGLLPLGIQAKIAYAPSGSDRNRSANTSTTIPGGTIGNMTMYQVSATPIDGLSVSASYGTMDAARGVKTNEQEDQSGAVAVKYATGPFTFGVSRSLDAGSIVDGGASNVVATTVEYYENTNFSIGFAVNENLSVSYSNESSEQNFVTASTVGYDQDTQSYQAAYTMGGMTIALARTDYDNVGYVNNVDVTETMFAVTMAF